MTDGRQPTLHVADRVEHTGFDPLPPEAENASKRRWWGSHVRELRWQAELARLLVDPIFRGAGVPPGDGSHVILHPRLPRRRRVARGARALAQAHRLRSAPLGDPLQRRLLRPRPRPTRRAPRADPSPEWRTGHPPWPQPRWPLRQGAGHPRPRPSGPRGLPGGGPRHPIRPQPAHQGGAGRGSQRTVAHDLPPGADGLHDRHVRLPLRA